MTRHSCMQSVQVRAAATEESLGWSYVDTSGTRERCGLCRSSSRSPRLWLALSLYLVDAARRARERAVDRRPHPRRSTAESSRAGCCPRSRCGSSRRSCRAPIAACCCAWRWRCPRNPRPPRSSRGQPPRVTTWPGSSNRLRPGAGPARTGGALRRCGSSPTRATPASCPCSGRRSATTTRRSSAPPWRSSAAFPT